MSVCKHSNESQSRLTKPPSLINNIDAMAYGIWYIIHMFNLYDDKYIRHADRIIQISLSGRKAGLILMGNFMLQGGGDVH